MSHWDFLGYNIIHIISYTIPFLQTLNTSRAGNEDGMIWNVWDPFIGDLATSGGKLGWKTLGKTYLREADIVTSDGNPTYYNRYRNDI